MSSMLTDGGSAPVAVPVVRGRHLAPRPRVRWPLVGSLVSRTSAPAEAQEPLHRSTKHRAQPAPDLRAPQSELVGDATAPLRVMHGAGPATDTAAGAAELAARHRTLLGRSASDEGLIEVSVAEGETVADIAGRYGVSTASVLALNGISWRTPIDAGAVILIRPVQRTAPAISTAGAVHGHAVETGETFSTIATRHGVSTAAILLANGLSRGSVIAHGQHLVIPQGTRQKTSTSTAEALALTGEMRGNARVIVSAGRALGVADDGVVAALAAAMQDSALRNLDFDGHDAGGLFHRPSGAGWGSMREVLNPTHASRAFFGGPGSPVRTSARGLLDVPGWQLMTVGEAASVVQHDGTASAYAKWEHCAREWLRDLDRAI